MEDYKDTGIRNIPNKLTLVRIAVIPLLMICYPLDIQFFDIFSAILFAIGAVTDFFDGYFARKYNSVSKLGKVLDPVADKLLTTAVIVLLSNRGNLPTFLAILFLCREIAISGIRLAAKEEGFSIDVTDLGKLKTAILDLSLFCLFINVGSFHGVGMVTAWIALLVSYFSAYQYVHDFWKKTNLQF
ncbi:MAG: CDP-diacylglycerol--glycerol-3-phosphate 3-phosphatidyltransferase [Oligoflexales bacterium]